LPLREAICAKLERDNRVRYTPDQIIVATGAKQALYNAVLALVNAGDEVIIPTPCWVSYADMVRLAEAVPVFVKAKADTYALDLEAIEQAITSKTRAILINTPHNPTGAVYDQASLRSLGELAVKHQFYIISDEVYEKLIYDQAKHVCVAALSDEIYKRCIVVNGLSKAYAMTGWRLGYAAGPVDLIRGMAKLQGHTTSNSTAFVQWAGIEALAGPQDSIEQMRKEFDQRRVYLLAALNALPGVTCASAQGAFYLMPNISHYFGKKTPTGESINNSVDFSTYILKRAHVAVVPGQAFFAPETVRVAYSNSLENIKQAVERMGEALKELS
jgi:aspartate aminotransferase